MPGSLLLLCHEGGYDHLYQMASCAAAATAGGWKVDAVFFFEALEKLAQGRIDELSFSPRDAAREERFAERIEEIGLRPPSVNLASARETGRLQLFACSASAAICGCATEELDGIVDEVIGWPTILRLMEGAAQTLYL